MINTVLSRNKGFTIIEVAVSITMIGLIAAVILPMFASTTDAAQRFETERKFRDLKQTLIAGYKANAFEIDSEPGTVIMVHGQSVLTTGMRPVATTFAWAEPYASASTATLFRDGYAAPLYIYVSARQTNNLYGSIVYSHKIALVSSGRNGRLDTGTTFDVNTGQLTLKGDDMGEIVDGFQIQREILDVTRKRIANIASAYHAYFINRYQSNESRNLNINYFVNGSRSGGEDSMFDTDGVVASTYGVDAPSDTLFSSVLGLAVNDFKDGYSNTILVDNSSDSVRTPDNSTAAMQSPPYTVIIKSPLPGNELYAQALIGSF